MSCSFLRDVPRLQNKNVSACRNRPRRFRLPTVGTITVGCQGLERSGKQKIFQALRNLEKFLRPLTANCYCATAPAHGRGSSFFRPRRAVCNTFPSPQQLRQDDSCVTLACIPLGGMSKFFLTFTRYLRHFRQKRRHRRDTGPFSVEISRFFQPLSRADYKKQRFWNCS